jgi:4-amino-4-deoxy-L-arabinose transferase-like glycosyltransferase
VNKPILKFIPLLAWPKPKELFSVINHLQIKSLAIDRAIPYILFFLGLTVYIITRLYRISDYPIYFFTDEAHIVLFGKYLLENKFTGKDSIFAPMYFEQAQNRWMPLLPVYFQTIAQVLFGKSIFVARAVSALITVAIPLASALILKIIFRSPIWWIGSMIPTFIPTLFLHSRTAFETVAAVSFYSLFLLFYYLYRQVNANYIIIVVIFAAFSFYSYSNSQMITAVTVILFLLSDFAYHLKKWRQLCLGILVAFIVSIPFIQYQTKHQEGLSEHLCKINSYWCSDESLNYKLITYGKKYFSVFYPSYWFLPNQPDVDRHRMQGYARFTPYLLPFLILGIFVSLIRIRRWEYRVLLLSLIAGPAGSALAEIGITRVLTMIFPMLMLSGIGLSYFLPTGQ